ncbi:MAG: STAS domain-containing protein [Pseudonocardia sp.]|nr:STAS domain-containing protein [Pseudonocardia sp.]
MTSAKPAADTDDQLTLAVRSEPNGCRVVAVGGEVDMLTSPRLRSIVLSELRPGVAVLVLDMEGITFLGTSGLAVLIELREACRSASVDLRLVCTTRRVVRPLTIAGLVPLFDIYPSQDTALAA